MEYPFIRPYEYNTIKTMNLYLVERSEHDYDEYDGFVVAAKSSKAALRYLEGMYNSKYLYCSSWPNEGKKTAKLIGTTDKYTETTIVLESFNAD